MQNFIQIARHVYFEHVRKKLKKKSIRKWLDHMGIEKYRINEDFSVDVKTHVHLSHKNLILFFHFHHLFNIISNYYCRPLRKNFQFAEAV